MKKRIFSLLLALLMVIPSAAMTASAEDTAEASLTAQAEPEGVLGDVNGDSVVDVNDAMRLFQYSMYPDLYPVSYEGSLDLNEDENIDIGDALRLFQYSMNPDMYPIGWGDFNPYPINTLTINGVDISEYVIATNTAAGGVMTYAAEELQEYIELSTGVVLPIESAGVPAGTKRILIDETQITSNDALRIYTDADGLVLAGTAKRSALYAVYHFLENSLNWRFFTADTEVCYEANEIDLSNVDYSLTLDYEIRDIYWTEYFDKDISVKRYQNGDGKRRMSADEHLGGDANFHPYGIHTFAALSETSETTQPCLNSEEVYANILKNAKAWLLEDTTRKAIHVSQNDNRRYCTCTACVEDLQKYRSPAGSIIKLVNRLDEDLKAAGLTDITIITFAYQYSFPCPKNITCNDDIAIELCTIDYCYNHAFNDPNCETNAYNMEQIAAWAEICDEFYIWDYSINFKYLLSPFPNFDVILENARVLASIGAKGMISQGNFQTVSGEFGALRCYLLAKAMENPNMTEEEYYAHMDQFLEAYYGPGWQYIRNFIDFITELSADKGCFGIYASPEDMFGSHGFAPHSDDLVEWFEKALELAETDLQKDHIRQSQICCEYLRIGAIHYEEINSGDQARVQAIKDATKALHDACKKYNVGRIAENCVLPDEINLSQNPRAWWNLHEYKE